MMARTYESESSDCGVEERCGTKFSRDVGGYIALDVVEIDEDAPLLSSLLRAEIC